jgi:5-methylcytosine-specific restriction endonuclease McrA
MPFPPKADPQKDCKTCGVALTRKRFASGRLEDRNVFLRREHCSLSCANTKDKVVKDTLHWRARKHRKDSCEECSTTIALHVHHVDRNPANNDPANLRTLCASCHLKLHWREDGPTRGKRKEAAA